VPGLDRLHAVGPRAVFREIGSLEPAQAAPPPALLEAAAVRAGLEFFL